MYLEAKKAFLSLDTWFNSGLVLRWRDEYGRMLG